MALRTGHADSAERATQILDAAEDLLLRWGHKRVTIDEIAKHAKIGKGTVYLHWKTRAALFEALMVRETVAVMSELLRRLRSDPGQVLLHRTMRSLFLIAMERPLSRALFTGDMDLLGGLAADGITATLQAQEAIAMSDYLRILRHHELLSTDQNVETQLHGLYATFIGFWHVEPFLGDQLSPGQRADALAHVLRSAFEPPEPPAGDRLAEIAAEVTDLFERYCADIEGDGNVRQVE